MHSRSPTCLRECDGGCDCEVLGNVEDEWAD
jgi:hypothetical protein